jgi:hypothetical protein
MNPFGSERRGQSAPIAVALLLAITVLGTVSVVALGATALGDTERTAQIDQAEHGMTQFDSRAAEVALSDTSVQKVDFSPGSGDFRVEEGVGRITVTHVNFKESETDGDEIDDPSNPLSDDDEEIYNGTLGAMVYENGDTTLAYQGGGVWRIDGDGDARMVSPPEFHYRSGTLTLPVIRTDGSGGASGDVSTTIRRDPQVDRTYPDVAEAYNGGVNTSREYRNPLSEGVVRVTVQSEYYAAWAEYFRGRTDGNVTLDPANESVELLFGTVGTTGAFDVPSDQSGGGSGKEIRGLASGHSLTDFDFSIVGRDDQNSRFKNLRWGMYVEKGNQQFEITLGGGGNVDCGETVQPVVYYSPDGGNTYQSWVATGGYTATCSDTDGDGKDEAKLSLEFTTSPVTMEYQPISGSDLSHFKDEVGSADFDTGNSEDLTADADHPAVAIDTGDTNQSEFVLGHYFGLLGPDFVLEVDDQQSGNAAGVDEADPESAGFVDYTGGDRVVTYLHITENGIEVRVE